MLAWRLFASTLLRHPARMLLSLFAIALGVALGVAVDTIHGSALDEFSKGLRQVAGRADLQVAGPREGFDEALYPALARHAAVAWASPVVEVDAKIAARDAAAGDGTARLQIVGIDPMRAWRVNPALIPTDLAGGGSGDRLGLLADDTLALTPAAARRLGVRVGDRIAFVAGSGIVELELIALLPGVGDSRELGVADIATVQSRFGRLGRLSRIDLKVAEGGQAGEATTTLAPLLPPGVFALPVDAADARSERMSRAYRVNLALLALIALLTGAFLVFSTQAARIVRRRGELAFLRAVGVSRREIMQGLLAEAALLGTLGSILGSALGLGLAALALRALGGDLGAGYFSGNVPALAISPLSLGLHMALGLAAALAGAWLPAREAASTPPALALKAGDDERALGRLGRVGPGLACLAAGLPCLLLPAVGSVPLGAYAAIGLWLAGAVMLLPWLARQVFARLPTPHHPLNRIALAQLRGAPGMASIGIAGIVAATAVAVAMAIMVGSFRESVDRWLVAVLPADLYVRMSRGGETGHLDTQLQQALARVPVVERVDLIRHVQVVVDPALPPVGLIARPMAGPPAALVGIPAALPASTDLPRLWASEAMADLYAWQAGQRVDLPLAGHRQAFVVAGFWRDYARSHGAVIVDREDYIRLTGDRLANDAAVFPAAGVAPAAVVEHLRALPAGDLLEIVDTGSIRKLSLGIFDRTFAITYALEAAAVLIGLAGVAASFAALAAARLREFGVLAHLGLTRRELQRLIATEGAAGAGLGIAVGLALGIAIALVLIHKVNRESFHWSMDFALPALPLAGFALAMLAGATGAAVFAARRAFGRNAIRAVREDW
jgi:putative ABC transport system permease protein